ncbi:heparan-alpha-glucosaminide N-acetyltransferase domain-containing protein, partial [Archangium violaceum]
MSLPSSRRLVSLDWMRGLAMVLMTLDHSSGAFNAGRFSMDGASRWKVGTALPAEQFLTRWVTHLCAPTFVFLAGAALALSLHRRLAEGEPPRGLDGFHLRRGLFIALLDPLWMSWILLEWGRWLLQVLYVLGVGMMCMVALRGLGTRALVGLGLLLIAGNEWLSAMLTHGNSPSVPMALLFSGGFFEQNHFIIG